MVYSFRRARSIDEMRNRAVIWTPLPPRRRPARQAPFTPTCPAPPRLDRPSSERDGHALGHAQPTNQPTRNGRRTRPTHTLIVLVCREATDRRPTDRSLGIFIHSISGVLHVTNHVRDVATRWGAWPGLLRTADMMRPLRASTLSQLEANGNTVSSSSTGAPAELTTIQQEGQAVGGVHQCMPVLP